MQDPLPGGRDLEHPSSLCAGAEIALMMQHDCAFSFLPVATSAPGQTPQREHSCARRVRQVLAGIKNKKIFVQPLRTRYNPRAGRPTPSVANDSRLHPVVGVVGNVGTTHAARGAQPAAPQLVGNVGNAPTSRVVGNVGNRAQSRVVGHVGNVVIEKKSARLQRCERCTLYAVYPYSILFFLTINRNHDPQCPQLRPRPMFSGLCAWAICPHSMTHNMTHNAHKMLRAGSH